MIEAAVGDREGAKQLLAAANITSIEGTQQGHSIPGLADAPKQMAKLAGRLSDHELMADAIDEAISAEGRAPDAILPDILSTLAEQWGHKECEVFLEEMLRRQPQLNEYSSLLSVYMSRFGNLKRAR